MLGFLVYAECQQGDILISSHGTWREALTAAQEVNEEKVKNAAKWHHDREPSQIVSVRIATFQDDGTLFETETVWDFDD